MTDPSLPSSSRDEAPIDAEFEPAAASDPKPGRSRSGPGWMAFGLLGLISAAALIISAALAGLVPGFKPGAKPLNTLQAELTELKSAEETVTAAMTENTGQIATLKSRADSLQADRTRAVSDIRTLRRELETLQADIATLQRARIASLAETDDASPAAETSPDLSNIETRVAALEDALVSQLGTYENSLEGLKARIADLETQAETESLTAANSTNTRTEAALALSAIEAAARRGRPFLSAQQKLAAAMPANQAVERLATIAPETVPTIADLRAAFPELRREALDRDAKEEGGASGWMRGLFGDGIQIRQSGEVTTNDRLDAAATALQVGDLSNAIQSVRALDANLQPVFTDWLDNAENRLTLEETLEALRLTMIAEERP